MKKVSCKWWGQKIKIEDKKRGEWGLNKNNKKVE